MSQNQKDNPWTGKTLTLQVKEVPGTTVSKDGHDDILLGIERTQHN